MPLLELKGVRAGYGPIQVLDDVSLAVDQGEIVTVIGSNGAGKTTTLNCISGVVRTRQGQIQFNGRPIQTLPSHEVVTLGISQSPEGRKIFPRLTVLENLKMGAFTRKDKPGIEKDLQHAFAMFPILDQRKHQTGGTLSGGEQQMLAIARALNTVEKLTVFLVEQNAFHALKLAHRGYVMVNGRITLAGTGRELLERPEVKAAYLEGGRHG